MEKEALKLQIDNLKKSCRLVIGYSATYLANRLKALAALSDAIYIRDYLQALFHDWQENLPFIGDSSFITCDWEKEEEEIRELAEDIGKKWDSFTRLKYEKHDLPSLQSFKPSDKIPPFEECFSWKTGKDSDIYELFGHPNHWKTLSAKTYPPCEEAVGWHMAQELERHFKSENRYDDYGNERFEELEMLAATPVAKAVVAMGSCETYLSDIGASILSEILEEIADLLDKTHRLLTKPHTIIGNKYSLEDAFTDFFKRIYMEYAVDKGMYRKHKEEFEAFRAAYTREDKYMNFHPWLVGECWNNFISSGFLQPYSRDQGENIETYSRFNEVFPAPQNFYGENYFWSLHANTGRYIYNFQLREKGWQEKTYAFLHYLILIDLYKGEEYFKFSDAQTDCLKDCVTDRIFEEQMLYPLQQCLQRVHVKMEEDNKKEKGTWQMGDWRHVFEICKNEKLVKEHRENFAKAIAEAIKQPEIANRIKTCLSQNSQNSTRRNENGERVKRVCKEIKEILSPVIDKMVTE